ncbi:hypothetical protein Tco_0492190 [Tanacetum coccineum]
MEIVPDNEVAIDAIPLVTKPPIIVDRKIIKEGKMGYFQIIRADGSSKRPEEGYERVLWGDLKVMFEPDVEKKRYPLTPATIIEMLNKKLQVDHWNEMCYQLLKLMTKQLKNPGSGRIVGIKRLFEAVWKLLLLRRGKVYNWETATYSLIWDNEDVHDLRSVETEFLAIVFNDTLTPKALLCEPTVSSLNNDEIDFRISFDESFDEDCTIADTAYPNPIDTAFDYLDVIQSLVSAQSIRFLDIATYLVEYVKFWDDWEVDRYGNANLGSKRRAFWSLNKDISKITILMTNTPYPSRKIRRIRACIHQRPHRNKLNTPYSERLNTPYSMYGINVIFWKISSMLRMTKVIKGEFEKLEDLKVKDVSLTYDTSLEVFNNKFNRLSRMDDDLFTYEVEVTNILCGSNKDDDSEQRMSHEADDDIGYDPSDVAFTEWIDTNIFDFKTPMYKTFKEFNYLLQIDPDLLTKDIKGFKTYDEYKDDWIYEWNKDIPWVDEKHRLTLDWREDGYCNGGNLPGAYHIGNLIHYQDLEWYEALEDSKLKDEALRNKAIMEGLISDDESYNDCGRRRKSHEINYHDYDEGEYEIETENRYSQKDEKQSQKRQN